MKSLSGVGKYHMECLLKYKRNVRPELVLYPLYSTEENVCENVVGTKLYTSHLVLTFAFLYVLHGRSCQFNNGE